MLEVLGVGDVRVVAPSFAKLKTLLAAKARARPSGEKFLPHGGRTPNDKKREKKRQQRGAQTMWLAQNKRLVGLMVALAPGGSDAATQCSAWATDLMQLQSDCPTDMQYHLSLKTVGIARRQRPKQESSLLFYYR